MTERAVTCSRDRGSSGRTAVTEGAVAVAETERAVAGQR